MPSLLMWAILVYIIKRSSQEECEKDIFKNMLFECEFLYSNMQPSLLCEVMTSERDAGSPSNKFYFLQLVWNKDDKIRSTEQSLFQAYLNSPFTDKSLFYSCESIWKDFIYIDPSILSDHCEKYDYCLGEVSNFIDKLNVKKVEILNSENINIFTILNEFAHLVEVNILNNSLFNISEVNFENFLFVKTLSVKGDYIHVLPDGYFSNMVRLETLDLSQNKIETLNDFSFGSLSNLKTLNLSFNEISAISKNSFAGLSNLNFIYVTNNKLESIDENMFFSNIQLKIIDLSFNQIIVLPHTVLHSLINLEAFICTGCNLTEVPIDLFVNSIKLMEVEFNQNEIKTISGKTFEKQASLNRVYLKHNNLVNIPEFKKKSHLRVLDLSHNEIISLNTDLDDEAPNMNYLNISANKIGFLADDHINNYLDLEILDLSENKITHIQLGSTTLSVRKLTLTNNMIRIFDVHWRRLVALEILAMDFNDLTHLELPPCIPSVKQTLTFSFQYNKISRLNVYSLTEDQNRVSRFDRTMAGCLYNGISKNFVDISNNPLICDCKLYPFHKYLKETLKIAHKIDAFLNVENTTCFGPLLLKNQQVVDLPDDVLSCPIATNCPEPCTCGIRAKDNKTFVNCSATDLSEAPQNVPLETTVLYFNKNHLKSMISLNKECWNNLTELHADSNDLVSLNDWDLPENLQYLSVRNNKIESLPQNLMNFIGNRSSFEFFYGGNIEKCNCSNKPLKEFLKENIDFVVDIEDIVCEVEGNGTLVSLYTIPDAVLCLKTVTWDFDPTVTLLSVCGMFVFLIILLFVYYRHRQLILSFLYIHCDEIFHFCFKDSDVDEDKVFDAFIAYSSCERHIVMELLHELEEKEPHFQLCIHERNWVPGRFISDNIISSVQSSKRTIVILSDNFIASPWFRLELRAAIFKVSGDRKNKIIVILADKSTSLDGIDTEIRHVISKRTYLVWGERWFWEKLKYVMPRKSCFEDMETDKTEVDYSHRRNSDIALMENI
ncbi:protein toll [Nephila pilipes]|uniref:Protein toll n=1 Tax=Nephila pilipes TaxID=299642 RepID=A0A8X6PRB2_NEPPI|nr:protein toll [Nephila pilipes]